MALKSEILRSTFLLIVLLIFFIYLNISKTSSTKYYQENKERLEKKVQRIYQIFLKKKKISEK